MKDSPLSRCYPCFILDCIVGSVTSIQILAGVLPRPLVLYQDLLGGWGQGLLKVLFSVLTQDLSTPSPSFSSGPQVHKEAEAFCSGLLCREMIVCTAFI